MMMMAGGTLWAFDISTRDELKQKIKRKRSIDGSGGSEEAEKELEEWLAGTLSTKDEKSRECGAKEGERGNQERRPR